MNASQSQRVQKKALFAVNILIGIVSTVFLPLSAISQGANMSNPIIMGTYSAGTYTYSDSKNTSSYGNDYGQSSPDIFYKFTVNGTATINISTCSSGWDTYLWILDANGTEVIHDDDNGAACSGLTASIVIPSSQTTITSLAAGTYYIVAEGYSSNTGIVNLSVSLTVQGAVTYNTRNFIRTWDATAPETNSNTLMTRDIKDVKQTTAYFDGLGRPEQTVAKKASLSNGVFGDIVSFSTYDGFGREALKYLPFAASTNDGLYKDNVITEQNNFYTGANSPVAGQGESFFYSKTNFEASPLNRINDTYAPGISWAGSESNPDPAQRRNVQMKYWSNTSTDDVKIWNVTDVTNGLGTYALASPISVYPAGALYKTATVDEQGKQVIEFKDKEGKVILKKVQLTSAPDDGNGRNYDGWLCTYYIYDDLNNLRCVIQPEGVKTLAVPANNWDLNYSSGVLLNEQCFRYEYDQRNRMIMKKVPGADVVYMIYDAKDRLVMTQDANLRNAQPYQKFLFIQYDDLNRPIRTGTISTTGDWIVHRDYAANSTNYPWVEGYTNEIFTQTFYDDYTWLAANGNPFSSSYNSAYDTYFQTPSNTWPYPQTNVQSNQLKGMVTGTRVKVLGSSTYLYTINFYDEKGRVIQLQSKNITGGSDIVTTQYTWAGQPLVTVQKQEKQGVGAQTTVIVTQLTYDDLGRLVKTEKKQSNTLVNSNVMSSYKSIAENVYDKLGQLKSKKLAPAFNSNAGIENLAYDYNIRGWMLGVNRNYLATTGQNGTTKFGFELGYDKLTNNSGRNFTTGQYNGNITGMIWKSDGDDVKRKYDFNYDAASRLLQGLFEQEDGTNTWNSTTMNYKIMMGDGSNPTTAYDNNGNIKAMTQYGWKLGGPATPIDNLTYNYMTNSNKLLNVIDANNDPATKLGDFRTSAISPNQTKTTTTVDYTYDANGNLKKDLNKDIGTASAEDIVYNYLNLPQTITVRTTGGAVKGTITYAYDATGNKLKKEVNETGQPLKTTLYIAGAVYENDVLQFIAHEEGRMRIVNNAFVYDYFIKDHLGNVRMVLTEEQKTNAYPVASLETSNVDAESAFYGGLYGGRINKSYVSGYPNDTYTSPNDAIQRLRGDDVKIGANMILKVMAGDRFNLRVNSWYKTYGANPYAPNPITELAGLLASGVAGVSGGKATSSELTNSGVSTSAASSFLGTQNYNINSNKPKAFINWIFLDEQFKYYAGGSDQVGNNEEFKTHLFNDVPINKSGYLYIYVSNETPNIDVFFDNLQVTHIRGPILEETHYYPFGLTMAGISSKALAFGNPENKKKFNDGTELANKEFSDGSGLEIYETPFRQYDAQTGRFNQIDPLSEATENWTPYAFCNNNPILFNDPFGLDTTVQGIHFTTSEWNCNVTVRSVQPKTVTSNANNQLPANQARVTPTLPQIRPYVPPNPYTNPNPVIDPVETPVEPLPIIGGTLLRGLGLTVVALLSPLKAGGSEFPNGDEGYYLHPHPYPGHGNKTENWNPHDVYMFKFTPAPGDRRTPVLKYGIYDVIKNPNRANSQMATFQALYGSSVTLSVLTRTTNRETALAIERLLVTGHVEYWKEMPRAQTRPGSIFDGD